MTNFENFKEKLTISQYVNRNIMECRFCPLREGCKLLSRSDCKDKLRKWCESEYVEIKEKNDD